MSSRHNKRKNRKRPNPLKVKIHRSYSVEDVARLFDIHKNTVRFWLKQGLKTNDDKRPILILGRDLSSFLVDRRKKAKCQSAPGEIYCVRCRGPKETLHKFCVRGLMD